MIAQLVQRLATDWSVRGTDAGVGEIFRARPHRTWVPSSLLYNGYRVSIPRIKRPELGVNHPPPTSAEVKERVELYRYSLYEPSSTVLEQILPLSRVWIMVPVTHFFSILYRSREGSLCPTVTRGSSYRVPDD